MWSGSSEVHFLVDRTVVVAIVVAGNQDHRTRHPRQFAMHELHPGLRHAVRVEQIASDQEEIGAFLKDPIDDFLKRPLNASAIVFPFLALAKGIALQMHVRGMNDLDPSA